MEPPADPPRFKCPPDFSACLFRPGPPFVQETLQDPSKELWLVRAPAGFSPESLDGHSMPLLGFQTLKASQPDGTEKLFHVQSALEHLAGAHLLLPAGPHGDQLTCSSPFGGSLSICEKYGDPGNNQPLFPVVARPAPQIPKGLKQRFLPFGSHPKRPPLSGAAEEPPGKKRKKKKKLGVEDSENQVPLLGTPLREVTGAGQAEARHQHKADGAALGAAGTQPSSTAVAQNGVLSGETEDPGPLNKKKKRKEDGEPQEEARGDAETRPQHENGTTPLVIDSMPSAAASAQDGLLFGQAEELDPRSKKKKKKKKRKDDREVREEMAEEAEDTHQCKEDDAVSGAAGSPPETPSNSAAFAQKGLLSGEAEAPGPRSKKKKRKEDREPKEEMTGEAEAASPHQVDGMTPWAVGSQPESEPVAQDGFLSGKMEDPAPSSKKKKRKDREPKEEMTGEAEAASPHQADGTTPWAISSQPESEPVAQDGLLSGKMEDPAPSSKKKKKKKRKEDREPEGEMRGEAEAASPHQADGTTPWAIGSQPESEPVAQDDLLSGKAEDLAPLSKKKKKRKEDREPKEEMGGEAEAASLHQAYEMMPWAVNSQPESEPIAQDDLLSGETEDSAPTSKRKKKKKRKEEAGPEAQGLLAGAAEPHTGEDRLPGTEGVTQDMHTGKSEEKVALPGPIASQEDAAGMLQEFRGPRPTPEDGLVLAAEEPEVGSSSHKGKKKKRKKEKEEAAQDLEGWPASQEVESQADLDSPLGGGERQEAAPGTEELTQKHKKKKKEHHRQ